MSLEAVFCRFEGIVTSESKGGFIELVGEEPSLRLEECSELVKTVADDALETGLARCWSLDSGLSNASSSVSGSDSMANSSESSDTCCFLAEIEVDRAPSPEESSRAESRSLGYNTPDFSAFPGGPFDDGGDSRKGRRGGDRSQLGFLVFSEVRFSSPFLMSGDGEWNKLLCDEPDDSSSS